jgi:AcrR family transcriptional regulator
LRERQQEGVQKDVVAAARGLFTRRGYERTSMADIAKEAGVSVQTIYSNVGGKPALLVRMQALLDEAGRVDELQRQIAEAADAREVLRLAARLRRAQMEGAGDVVRILLQAMATDPEVQRAWADGQRKSRLGMGRIVARLVKLKALRRGLSEEEAVDSMFALLAPMVYLRLLDECGWEHGRIEAWTADVLQRQLLPAALVQDLA